MGYLYSTYNTTFNERVDFESQLLSLHSDYFIVSITVCSYKFTLVIHDVTISLHTINHFNSEKSHKISIKVQIPKETFTIELECYFYNKGVYY